MLLAQRAPIPHSEKPALLTEEAFLCTMQLLLRQLIRKVQRKQSVPWTNSLVVTVAVLIAFAMTVVTFATL